ncbi:hypothetical protein FRB99_001266 [Tulasnella sp. 403]|nr:hypothetical protein FRB99_001266 [Tulasnella sp. 403]
MTSKPVLSSLKALPRKVHRFHTQLLQHSKRTMPTYYAANPDKVLGLSDIPTFRQSYADGTLEGKESRYPFNDSWLDKVSLLQGDITKLKVDAIVNAANRSLMGGSGGETFNNYLVDRIEHIQERFQWTGPSTRRLEEIFSKSNSQRMQDGILQDDKGLQFTRAFCAISTGVYGYPITDATNIALDTIREFLDSSAGNELDRIVFVVFTDRDTAVYRNLIPEYFPAPTAVAPSNAESGSSPVPVTGADENTESKTTPQGGREEPAAKDTPATNVNQKQQDPPKEAKLVPHEVDDETKAETKSIDALTELKDEEPMDGVAEVPKHALTDPAPEPGDVEDLGEKEAEAPGMRSTPWQEERIDA